MTIGSVVIDCNDLAIMSSFWQAALGYEPRDPGTEDFVVLADPGGVPPNVSLQRVPEAPRGKNRLHLDLYSDAPESEIDRLIGLGATRYERQAKPNEDFVVLADPEGALFCVIDKRR